MSGMSIGKVTNTYTSTNDKCAIEGPWQMLAADILEVPISRHHNRYLLVVVDYLTKWAEAIPLWDQTAASISAAVIKICCSFGVPDIVYLDQGKNFETHLFHQVLSASNSAIQKSRTTVYHPQGDGMFKDSTALSSSYCVAMLRQKMIGNSFYWCWFMHITQLHTLQLSCHPLNWCLGDHYALVPSRIHTSLIPLYMPVIWKLNFKPCRISCRLT